MNHVYLARPLHSLDTRFGRLYKSWRARNRIPRNPTLRQRIFWHKRHQKHHSCRPVPPSLMAAFASSIKRPRFSRRSSKTAPRSPPHHTVRLYGAVMFSSRKKLWRTGATCCIPSPTGWPLLLYLCQFHVSDGT